MVYLGSGNKRDQPEIVAVRKGRSKIRNKDRKMEEQRIARKNIDSTTSPLHGRWLGDRSRVKPGTKRENGMFGGELPGKPGSVVPSRLRKPGKLT